MAAVSVVSARLVRTGPGPKQTILTLLSIGMDFKFMRPDGSTRVEAIVLQLAGDTRLHKSNPWALRRKQTRSTIL